MFNGLLQRLQTVESNRSKSDKLLSISNVLDKLFMNIKKATSRELLNKHQLLGALADPGPCSLNSCNSFGAGRDACWIPVDVFMEITMDGKHLYAISSVEVLIGIIVFVLFPPSICLMFFFSLCIHAFISSLTFHF